MTCDRHSADGRSGLDDRHSRIRMPRSDAGIAQLVEHDLAKVGVASSSLVSRSSLQTKPRHVRGFVVSGLSTLPPHPDSRPIQKSVIAAIHKRRHSAIIHGSDAGIAQLVEHDLAKVGVASSSLVSRSSFLQSLGSPGFCFFQATAIITVAMHQAMARWQSGHAAACKAAYAGSIPTLASIAQRLQFSPQNPPLAGFLLLLQDPASEAGLRLGAQLNDWCPGRGSNPHRLAAEGF